MFTPACAASARSADGLYVRSEVMRPSCTNGTNGASGSIVARRSRCSGDGGREGLVVVLVLVGFGAGGPEG